MCLLDTHAVQCLIRSSMVGCLYQHVIVLQHCSNQNSLKRGAFPSDIRGLRASGCVFHYILVHSTVSFMVRLTVPRHASRIIGDCVASRVTVSVLAKDE